MSALINSLINAVSLKPVTCQGLSTVSSTPAVLNLSLETSSETKPALSHVEYLPRRHEVLPFCWGLVPPMGSCLPVSLSLLCSRAAVRLHHHCLQTSSEWRRKRSWDCGNYSDLVVKTMNSSIEKQKPNKILSFQSFHNGNRIVWGDKNQDWSMTSTCMCVVQMKANLRTET